MNIHCIHTLGIFIALLLMNTHASMLMKISCDCSDSAKRPNILYKLRLVKWNDIFRHTSEADVIRSLDLHIKLSNTKTMNCTVKIKISILNNQARYFIIMWLGGGGGLRNVLEKTESTFNPYRGQPHQALQRMRIINYRNGYTPPVPIWRYRQIQTVKKENAEYCNFRGILKIYRNRVMVTKIIRTYSEIVYCGGVNLPIYCNCWIETVCKNVISSVSRLAILNGL